MIQLFLRFYLGVLLILATAWAVQSYKFQPDSGADGMQMIKDVVGGGARLARDILEDAEDAEEREAKLNYINSVFDYPVRLRDMDQTKHFERDHFVDSDDIAVRLPTAQLLFATPMKSQEEVLVFGAYPLWVPTPNQLATMSKLGIVFFVTALAIAFLLRPVAVQLHAMEKTATAIADGELSARVNEGGIWSVSTLARAFNTMADRVERLLATQRELLQVVSHELRTPVSRIHFAVDLARNADTDQEREQRFTSLDAAADELDDLVAELLQYVQMETGRLPLELQDVPLRSLTEELINELSPLHPSLRYKIGEELQQTDMIVVADRHRLKRALSNILRNASRFAASQVVINAAQQSGSLIVQVDDDGGGIDAADRTRVFEPFVRCDEEGSGTGLGLALVQRIVTRHGGSVCALESPLGGARFQINVPLQGSNEAMTA